MKHPVLTVLGVVMLCVAAHNTYAAEKPAFDAPLPRSSYEALKLYSINSLSSDIESFSQATDDLNNDGLEEFILRTQSCDAATGCTYHILAETKGDITPLGTLQGHNLLLGNEYSHGVRNLLVFTNPSNDFDYDLYTWHPEHSSYRISKP